MIARYFNALVLYPLLERLQKRAICFKLRQLREYASWPFRERRRLAHKRLADVLRRAAATVPYYRDLFRARGFDPGKAAKDIGYFQDLPFLTKEIIREQGLRLLNENLPYSGLHRRKTGGSTGPSTFLYYSGEALDWTAAVNLFVLENIGKHRHRREVHLSSRFPEAFSRKDRLREWIKCMAMNRLNVLTDSVDERGLESVWRRLRRANAYLVHGHPSFVYTLALYGRRRGHQAHGLFKVFESTGEVLDSQKRRVIAEVFGCQVVNRYGSAEFGVVAYETPAASPGRLQVLDAVVWPETAPHSGGTELVLTGLQNPAMPLIRYRTGDLGELLETEHGYYLDNLVGRAHDLVRIGGREYPSQYIQDLLDRIGGIDEFQLEPRDPDPLLLRLVVPDAKARPAIAARIQAWWQDAVRIEFTTFEGMKHQGWRAKFRHVMQPPPDNAATCTRVA